MHSTTPLKAIVCLVFLDCYWCERNPDLKNDFLTQAGPWRVLPDLVGAPLGLCRGGDLCGLYSALPQDGKLVVEDIPLVVWELCFSKVVGLYPRWGYIYAAIFYVLGGYGQSVLSGVFLLSYPLSCEFKYALSNSLFLSFFLSLGGGPEP
jgi:hypothetical protein